MTTSQNHDLGKLRRKPRQLSTILLFGGPLLWFAVVVAHTGAQAFVALAAVAFYLAVLVAVTGMTRTVPLRSLLSMFMFGTAAMIITSFLIKFFGGLGLAEGTFLRDFFVPLLEEAVKIAAVAVLLWKGRKFASRFYGVSDIILLAAASGAGFSAAEEAALVGNSGAGQLLWWMPVVHVWPDAADAGHAIWTTIAGATLAFAVVMGFRKPWMKRLALCGVAWSFFDHFSHNYTAGHPAGGDFLGSVLNVAHGAGWLSIWLMMLLVAAAVFYDLQLLKTNMAPSSGIPAMPPAASNFEQVKDWWDLTLWHRRAGYIASQIKHTEGVECDRLSKFHALITRGLGQSKTPDATATSAGDAPATTDA